MCRKGTNERAGQALRDSFARTQSYKGTGDESDERNRSTEWTLGISRLKLLIQLHGRIDLQTYDRSWAILSRLVSESLRQFCRTDQGKVERSRKFEAFDPTRRCNEPKSVDCFFRSHDKRCEKQREGPPSAAATKFSRACCTNWGYREARHWAFELHWTIFW